LLKLSGIFAYKAAWSDVKQLIKANWAFVIIGGISFANFRVANVLISKFLGVEDVANYEIAYKVFAIAQMIPVIISSSVFPALVKYYRDGDLSQFRNLYKKVYLYYLLFGAISFTFVFSFADTLLPFAFGSKYDAASMSTIQMFLTMLVFPTAYLQANVIVAMKMEKADMWFNVVLLGLNLLISTLGLTFYPSLFVINIAFFVSFLIFHILQDILLTKKGVGTLSNTAVFYLGLAALVMLYIGLSQWLDRGILFLLFWMTMSLLIFVAFKWRLKGKVLVTGKVEG
jgi:O-antigen/teichoic acid export membrane protein